MFNTPKLPSLFRLSDMYVSLPLDSGFDTFARSLLDYTVPYPPVQNVVDSS